MWSVFVTGTGATLDYEDMRGKFKPSCMKDGAVFTLHSERDDRDYNCEIRRLNLVS